MTMASNPLARLESARDQLALARTVDEVKELRDKAEVARLYARERDLGLEAQNYAAEIKIRAERKLGELIPSTIQRGGDRYWHPTSDRTRLDDLGISYDQSSQWQQIARIPESEFETHIAVTKAEDQPLTTSGVVRMAHVAHISKREPKPCSRCATPTRHHCQGCRAIVCALCLSPRDYCPECAA